MRKIIIGIIGDSEIENPEEISFCEKLGEELAKRGFVIISGGRTGVMEAVSKGAKKVDGLTIGILPSGSKNEANPYIDIPIPTNLGWTRNSIVPLASDILIAVGGKAGTLSEMAYGWMYGKPIIGVVGFGGWSEKLAGKKIDDRRDDVILPARTIEEILGHIEKIIKKFRIQ